ncbi:class I SAM-dependent methyltransferase, partial [Vibrio parahaemolyticus]
MDIDKDVINVFCKVYGSDNSQDELALQYDVHHELPEKVSGRFDYVVIDPPWYQHYFEKFINRA